MAVRATIECIVATAAAFCMPFKFQSRCCSALPQIGADDISPVLDEDGVPTSNINVFVAMEEFGTATAALTSAGLALDKEESSLVYRAAAAVEVSARHLLAADIQHSWAMDDAPVMCAAQCCAAVLNATHMHTRWRRITSHDKQQPIGGQLFLRVHLPSLLRVFMRCSMTCGTWPALPAGRRRSV